MRILRKSGFTATPWKNGGGITHEVIRVPPGDGAFRWRVSIAQIDVSGPFSDFSGYRRTMVLLRGGGVRLTFDDASLKSLMNVGDMAEFDGALKTDCCLVDGPCTDLNLMVAASVAHVAAVEQLREPRRLPALRRGVSLVLGITGGLAVECAAGRAQLDPWDLAILAAEGPDGTGTVVAAADPSSLVFLATLTDNST